jgi:hypothetical protein
MLTLDRIWIRRQDMPGFSISERPARQKRRRSGSVTRLSDVQRFWAPSHRPLYEHASFKADRGLATPPDPAPLSEHAARHAHSPFASSQDVVAEISSVMSAPTGYSVASEPHRSLSAAGPAFLALIVFGTMMMMR